MADKPKSAFDLLRFVLPAFLVVPAFGLVVRYSNGGTDPDWILWLEPTFGVMAMGFVIGFFGYTFYHERELRDRGEDPRREWWTDERIAEWQRKRAGGFWNYLRDPSVLTLGLAFGAHSVLLPWWMENAVPTIRLLVLYAGFAILTTAALAVINWFGSEKQYAKYGPRDERPLPHPIE